MDFDIGKSVPPFCHCHVRVGFFIGLADSLGKNWEIEWKQFRSAQEEQRQAK